MKILKKLKFYFLVFLLSFLYGYTVNRFQIFPYNLYSKFRAFLNPVSFKPYSKNQIDSFALFFSEKLIVNPLNVDSLRGEISNIVFGRTLLPSNYPTSVTRIVDGAYKDLVEIKKIEKFEVNLQFGFNSVGYIFHPVKSNNRLILYHQGHDGDFILGKSTISYFLKKGYTVYAFSLPLYGKNNQPVVITKNYGVIRFKSNHDYFMFLPNPISYFIEPIIVMLNYAQKFSFDSISMVGISGGGWVTTLAAALDKRINYSFPVAGSYPLAVSFIRPESNIGDFEQLYPPLTQSVDYLDLYLLGSEGRNRSQTQILNLNDPCCFNGYEYQLYTGFLCLETLKYQNARFNFISDSLNYEHSISANSLRLISNEIDSLSN